MVNLQSVIQKVINHVVAAMVGVETVLCIVNVRTVLTTETQESKYLGVTTIDAELSTQLKVEILQLVIQTVINHVVANMVGADRVRSIVNVQVVSITETQ